jgi:putative Holliday junction resolvase
VSEPTQEEDRETRRHGDTETKTQKGSGSDLLVSSSPPLVVSPSPLLIPSAGRLLGVDFGAVRVGLAVCDPDRRIASALDTYTRRTPAADAAFFRKLAADERAAAWVVGLAISLNGTEGPKAKECRAFGAWLAAETGMPVAFHDERFTTAAAEDYLRGAKLSPEKRKALRDRVAAQLILQAFLDAGCPPSPDPVPTGGGSA